jgi:hypothetical protein
MKTKEELVKEQGELVELIQGLEKQKTEIMTRLVEIQGILKYLAEEVKEEKK